MIYIYIYIYIIPINKYKTVHLKSINVYIIHTTNDIILYRDRPTSNSMHLQLLGTQEV